MEIILGDLEIAAATAEFVAVQHSAKAQINNAEVSARWKSLGESIRRDWRDIMRHAFEAIGCEVEKPEMQERLLRKVEYELANAFDTGVQNSRGTQVAFTRRARHLLADLYDILGAQMKEQEDYTYDFGDMLLSHATQLRSTP